MTEEEKLYEKLKKLGCTAEELVESPRLRNPEVTKMADSWWRDLFKIDLLMDMVERLGRDKSEQWVSGDANTTMQRARLAYVDELRKRRNERAYQILCTCFVTGEMLSPVERVLLLGRLDQYSHGWPSFSKSVMLAYDGDSVSDINALHDEWLKLIGFREQIEGAGVRQAVRMMAEKGKD